MANHQVGLLLFLLYTQLTWGQFPDTRNNVAVNQNQRIRTAYDENLQDSVDFAAFQPSSWPYYWVPTKDEARNEALKVPFSPSVDTQLTNEIEFHKSNELLVPVADNKPQKYKYTPARHRIHYQHRSEEHSLNSSHITISYAVFCLKKKNKYHIQHSQSNTQHTTITC